MIKQFQRAVIACNNGFLVFQHLNCPAVVKNVIDSHKFLSGSEARRVLHRVEKDWAEIYGSQDNWRIENYYFTAELQELGE